MYGFTHDYIALKGSHSLNFYTICFSNSYASIILQNILNFSLEA